MLVRCFSIDGQFPFVWDVCPVPWLVTTAGLQLAAIREPRTRTYILFLKHWFQFMERNDFRLKINHLMFCSSRVCTIAEYPRVWRRVDRSVEPVLSGTTPRSRATLCPAQFVKSVCSVSLLQRENKQTYTRLRLGKKDLASCSCIRFSCKTTRIFGPVSVKV